MERTFSVEIGVAGYEGDSQTWYNEYIEVKLLKELADKLDTDGGLAEKLFETAQQTFLVETEDLVAGVFNISWEEVFEDEEEFDCE